MKPYEHPAYSDPVVATKNPIAIAMNGISNRETAIRNPTPNIMERIPKNAQAEALNYSFLLQSLTFR